MDPLKQLKILFVEDVPTDVELAERALRKAGINFESMDVCTEEAFLSALETFNPDLIISDYSMPEFDGMRALQLARAKSTDLPFIMLTAAVNQETAIECMKNGAWNYVFKDRIARLAFAVREAVEKSETLASIKASEDTQRENEIRFRTIMNSTQDVIYTLDRDQRHTGVYGRWVEKSGLRPEHFIGKTATEIMGRESARVHIESNLKALAGEFVVYDWSVSPDSGSRHFQTSLSPIYNSKGIVDGILGVGRDITERKIFEKALQESDSRTKAMFQALPDLIFRISRQGVFLDYKADITDLYVQTESGIIGRQLREFLPPVFSDMIENEIDTTLATGKLQTFEYQLPMKSRGLRDYEARMVPSGDNEVITIVRDVTEQKRAAAEKESLEQQIHHLQKEESLGRMAGAIAHRFNNLLQGILGNLELALNVVPLGEAFDYLTDAIGTSHKASEISRLMLTYMGQTTGIREPVDFAQTCQRYLPLLQSTIPKDVILRVDLPLPGPNVKSNVTQIQQILANLITNSWEAISPNSGEIVLSVRKVPVGKTLEGRKFPVDWQPQEQTYACLEVTDTGCGIDNEDINKILDPFYSTKFTGRGLGLAAVLGIVKSHGGVLTIESKLGEGSTFRIFLPLCKEEITRNIVDTTSPATIDGSKTVLLVEDEQQIRTLATIMLNHLGYNVVSAVDGVEALEVFREHQAIIDCVLCDLIMPRMNGWMTLSELRKIEPGIPVILVSGYDEVQVMQGEHSELPQAILGKPFNFEALQNAIASAIGVGEKKSG